MILAAGLLVLLGLGLFVTALLTGLDALYWGCVAACAVAAGVLVAARRGMSARSTSPAAAPVAASEGTATGNATAASPPAATGATAAGAGARGATDPGVEEVEVTDLLVVVDLTDEVLVVDEHPRYHVAGCAWLSGRETIPMPLDEARTDGFTPCAVCRPDRTLAERARSRR